MKRAHYLVVGLLVGGLSTALLGCGSAPEEPGWNDVARLFASNCVRCHSVPSIGGAPDSFRLDVWEDTIDADGRRIFGAGAMAEFAAARAGTGAMPPRELELDGNQMDTLDNWVALRAMQGQAAPPGTPPIGNEAPTIRLRGDLPTLAGDPVSIDYEIGDADRDLVTGELVLRSGGDLIIARDLRNGRHSVEIDPGQVPAGSYRLIAVIKDHPTRVVEVDLGSATVENAGGNVAPAVAFASPTAYGSIFADSDSPVTVTVNVTDPDTNSLQLTVEAVRGAERVEVASQGVAPGETVVDWDTTGLTAGPGWTLVARINDGALERRTQVGRITISHSTTELRWADVADILVGRCVGCHFGNGSRVPGLTLNLGDYDDVGAARGVFSARGHIYQRLVLQGTMPPPSARQVLNAYQQISDEERELLEDWLEGGAPQ